MPISEDVDRALIGLREKYETRQQVFSSMDMIDDMNQMNNLLVDSDVIGGQGEHSVKCDSIFFNLSLQRWISSKSIIWE